MLKYNCGRFIIGILGEGRTLGEKKMVALMDTGATHNFRIENDTKDLPQKTKSNITSFMLFP